MEGMRWSPEVSTHAPREGSDHGDLGELQQLVIVSTHAPREGSDSYALGALCLFVSFNPRSP